MPINVWTYWSGDKPGWIDVCLKSIKHRCDTVQFNLLTPENVDDYVDAAMLNPRWKTLPPGVGTDCLRAALLAYHGGIWIDADTVCVADIGDLFRNRHKTSEFLYSRWRDGRVIAGYVYSPAKHPVALRWLDGVQSALRYASHIGWGDLGEKMLTPIVNTGSVEYPTWEIPRETFLPVDVDGDVHRYFKASGWKDFMTESTIAFGLNYSWMMEHKRNCMERCFDPNPYLMIHRLLSDAKQTLKI